MRTAGASTHLEGSKEPRVLMRSVWEPNRSRETSLRLTKSNSSLLGVVTTTASANKATSRTVAGMPKDTEETGFRSPTLGTPLVSPLRAGDSATTRRNSRLQTEMFRSTLVSSTNNHSIRKGDSLLTLRKTEGAAVVTRMTGRGTTTGTPPIEQRERERGLRLSTAGDPPRGRGRGRSTGTPDASTMILGTEEEETATTGTMTGTTGAAVTTTTIVTTTAETGGTGTATTTLLLLGTGGEGEGDVPRRTQTAMRTTSTPR
mmetsp:Transcript_43857/g.86554  ORF Transcript_43857/g.86554 Transcript_43857/m.86554 type:complete len:260 (-) Transcript_43857:760-1539(-)